MYRYALGLTSLVIGVLNALWLYWAFGLSGLFLSIPLNIAVGGVLGWLWPLPPVSDPWPKPKQTGDPDVDSLALNFYLLDLGLKDPMERFEICRKIYPTETWSRG